MYNNILDIEGLKVGQVEDRNGSYWVHSSNM